MYLTTSPLPSSLVYLIRRIINALSSLSIPAGAGAVITPAHSGAATGTGPVPTQQAHVRRLSSGPAADSSPNPTPDAPKSTRRKPDSSVSTPETADSPIGVLLRNPTLFSPLRVPRLPIILCHGLYGFDVRGPSAFPRLQLHYWSTVLDILREKIGAEVRVVGVGGTDSIVNRAKQMDVYLQEKMANKEFNLLAHSMGGLDSRYLLSHIRPESRQKDGEGKKKPYYPKSLTTLATPHRGSPFMDWCLANIGIGVPRRDAFSIPAGVDEPEGGSEPPSHDKPEEEDTLNPPSDTAKDSDPNLKHKLPYSLPSPLFPRPSPVSPYPLPLLSAQTYTPKLFSLPTLLLSLIDSPAYSNLTTSFLDGFNKRTPDVAGVKYMSVACRKDRSNMGVWNPLWWPKVVVDGVQQDVTSVDANTTSSYSLQAGESGSPASPPSSPTAPSESGLHPPSNGHLPSQFRASYYPTSKTDLSGNDGLVPVHSAVWGDFLGIIDNCDHWEIRGAGGLNKLNLNFNLGFNLGLGSMGEGWSEAIWRSRNGEKGGGGEKGNGSVKEEGEKIKERIYEAGRWATSAITPGDESVREKDGGKDGYRDREVKALTERLSAVVDWIVDRSGEDSTSSTQPATTTASVSSPSNMPPHFKLEMGKALVSGKDTKLDLERFYVGLCRKLYDEGL